MIFKNTTNILCLFLTLILSACYKVEKSEFMFEPGEITEIVYTPSQDGHGTGVGMSMKGTLVLTSSNMHVPASYAVVFQCQHGKFIIDKKEVWEKASKGKVAIKYREVYHVDDETHVKTFSKYEFIDFEKS